MPDRVIRFTEQFFNRLDWLLPKEREGDGTPSITDFIVHELPRVRDRLASDYFDHTLATDDPDVRVWIGAGTLVHRFTVYVGLEVDDIEVFWISIELVADEEHDPDAHWNDSEVDLNTTHLPVANVDTGTGDLAALVPLRSGSLMETLVPSTRSPKRCGC